jgi:signal transduction histidine kinase
MTRRITLSEKLIISFMLLSMGAIGIVGGYSYYSARKAQMARTYDQLASVRYLKRKEVEAFYLDRLREAQALASKPEIAELLSQNPGSSSHRKEIKYKLSTIVSSDNYNRLFIFSEGKIKSFSSGANEIMDLADRVQNRIMDSLFKIPGSGSVPYISDLVMDAGRNEWVQYLVVPVRNPILKEYSCFMALELRTAELDSLMADRSPLNGLGISGESYLAGRDRLLRSSSRFLKNSIFVTRIDTSTARLAFSGSDGTYLMNDYRGIQVLGSFSTLRPPCPDWAVIAEIDLNEAMVPIYSIRNNVIFITVFIAIIVFFATWWLSRKISNPVIRLQKAAQELGEGKLGTLVAVTTNDEIGELAISFNQMSEQLKEKELELQKERAGRMRAAFDGQDMERQRLSRELHDGLGQSLIAQKLRLESIRPEEPERTVILLDDLKLCADQLVDEVRRISNALMPAQLTQFGIIAALRQHCDEISKYSNIEVTFDPTGTFEFLNRKTKTYLFRIVQEALNNAVKHSGANIATVEIAQTRENIFLSIADNGKGFNPESICQGNGMNNMRERTNLLQGSLTIDSQSGKGTTIEIRIPIIGSN